MNYTKGPWIVDGGLIYSHGPSRRLSGDSKDCPIIVELKDLFNQNDAHLIAAAPDLLEALEDLLDAYESNMRPTIPARKARAVLAKAKRETP